QQNPVVHACVALIAKSVADIPWILRDDRGNEIVDHPLLERLKQPNPAQDFREFLKSVVSYREISGNAYIERTREDAFERMELYSHRPDRMQIIPGDRGLPQGYKYTVDGQISVWEVDFDKGLRPILHLKTFHPTDDWYGQSPLDACAWAIDQH